MATQRVRTCTLCGCRVEQIAVDAWANGMVLVAVVLCAPCRQRDPQRTAVRAMLEARYTPSQRTEDGHAPSPAAPT